MLPSDPNSKAARCAETVFEIWQRTADKRSTQMIFCDLSTPGKERPIEMVKKEDGSFGMAPFQNVYDDIRNKLLDMGIPGLLVFLFMAFLLIQKTLTCLKVCESTNDTVRILGGLTAWIGLLIYGLVSNTLANPAVMMTVIVVLSVCNAFQNVVFDRWDMVVAGMSRENNSTDCMVHAP